MKIRRNQSRRQVASRDLNRSKQLRARLAKISSQVARKQDKEFSAKHALKRSSPETLQSATPETKARLTLNVSGNRRGLNMRENPPTSEHMKKIRAMRRMYNKQMPTLQCNSCAFASTCPQMKAGYECAFLPFLNSHKVDTVDDLLFYMKELLSSNMRRTHLQLLMETLQGGQPSLETSEALNLAFMQLNSLHEKMTEKVDAQLTVEGGEGVIAKLFGNLDQLVEDTTESFQNPIVVSPVKSDSPPVTEESTLMLENIKPTVNVDLVRRFSKEEIERHTGVHEAEVVMSTLKKKD